MKNHHILRAESEWWTPLYNTRVFAYLTIAVCAYVGFGLKWWAGVPWIAMFGLAMIVIAYVVTYVEIGFNRCVINDGFLLLQEFPWHRTTEKHEILSSTCIEVDRVRNGWFAESLSAAFPSFANVRVVPRASKTSGIYMLAKTDRQISQLQQRLDRALELEKQRLGIRPSV